LEREPDPKSGKVKVTFRLPAAAGATVAWVAGEWNDWSHLADKMEPTADGTLECTVPLQPGQSYRFRYYLGGGRWENDWDADSYVDNEFGGADSVVTLARIDSSGRSNGGCTEPGPPRRRVRVDDLG
jgi:1,4-alpha-glucan branching enzyme